MDKHTQTLAKVLFAENLSASEIARRTGLSQPTVSRALNKAPVIRIGQGRASLYAWVDTAEGHPVYAITTSGKVNAIATLYRQPNGRTLLVHEDGYYAYDDVPWFLNSVLPAGFLGRLHGESLSRHLPVNKNPALWSGNEAFLYLLNEGRDLSGNLLMGKASAQRYLAKREQLTPVVASDYDGIAREINQIDFAGSSVAGEQPKFLAYVDNADVPYHAIVKYSAPLSLESPGAQRYRDLLVAEHLALQCLQVHGVEASASRLIEGERLYLEIRRFDRVAAHGRRGIVSLRDIEAEFIGESMHWYEAADSLLRLKMIDAPTQRTIHLLYAFGMLIGNTDMHFGNLSFYFEGLELQGLTPVYDMLPMMYMPVRDEVVAREFKVPVLLGIADDVQREAALLAEDYWHKVGEDERISGEFSKMVYEESGLCRLV